VYGWIADKFFDQQIDVLQEERFFGLYKEIRLQDGGGSGLKFTWLVWSLEFLFCTFALTPIGQRPNPSDMHHYSHVFCSLSLLYPTH
jgi:hypothetical protein